MKKASKLSPPENPTLKESSDFVLIGKEIPSLAQKEKASGEIVYGSDFSMPGFLVALPNRAPGIGQYEVEYDKEAALAVPGVTEIFEFREDPKRYELWPGTIRTTVVVLAEHTWAAIKGSEALGLKWKRPGKGRSYVDMQKQLATALRSDKADIEFARGKPAAARKKAPLRHEGVYEFPFAKHLAMEPTACAARVGADKVEVWVPCQNLSRARDAAAYISGVDAKNVTATLMHSGGQFGRGLSQEYVMETVLIAQETGKPVRLFTTREQTFVETTFHPATRLQVRAGLDKNGGLLSFEQHVAGFVHDTPVRKNIIIAQLCAGFPEVHFRGLAQDVPYEFPDVRYWCTAVENDVLTGAVRGVGRFQNCVARECFLNEIAAKFGQDPVAMRRELLKKAPAFHGVLDGIVEHADWSQSDGKLRGLSLDHEFGTSIAIVAEGSRGTGKHPTLERITAVVDCGQVVHRRSALAQLEGGIVDGLARALYGGCGFKNGEPTDRNFDDHPFLRSTEIPEIKAVILPSTRSPTGLGEAAIPGTAAAVMTVFSLASEKPIRSLPLKRSV